jgi:hypothetical protein
MVSKVEIVSEVNESATTRMYFMILCDLVEENLKSESKSELIDANFFTQTVQRLMAYKSAEQKGSMMEDYTLIGHFNLLRLFLVYKPEEIKFETLE